MPRGILMPPAIREEAYSAVGAARIRRRVLLNACRSDAADKVKTKLRKRLVKRALNLLRKGM